MKNLCFLDSKCNFDNDTYCMWHNVHAGDNFDWILHQGETPSDNTGPTSDHTTGTPQGRLVYRIKSNNIHKKLLKHNDLALCWWGRQSGMQVIAFTKELHSLAIKWTLLAVHGLQNTLESFFIKTPNQCDVMARLEVLGNLLKWPQILPIKFKILANT